MKNVRTPKGEIFLTHTVGIIPQLIKNRKVHVYLMEETKTYGTTSVPTQHHSVTHMSSKWFPPAQIHITVLQP